MSIPVIGARGSATRPVDGGGDDSELRAAQDALNQLTDFRRGTLSDTNSDNIPDTVTTASRTQSWSLDALGNFSTQTTDGTAQNRTHNKQNEVTVVGASNLTFDNSGNTTTDDNGKTLVYDAWNRLVSYKNGMTVLESYQYDALNRRIVQNPGTATDLYYSSAWQVLEEQVGGVSKVQYVWSPVYVDAIVLRDRDADGNSSNGLEERLYAQQDANWNVTALVNTSGSVVERYVYDPYGKPTFLNASWGTLGNSAYASIYLFQGGRFNTTDGLYQFRYRDISPTLGRWLQVDPILFQGGDGNLFRFLRDNPVHGVDPSGRATLRGPYLCCTLPIPRDLCFGACTCTNVPFVVAAALIVSLVGGRSMWDNILTACCHSSCTMWGAPAAQPGKMTRCVQRALNAAGATCTCI